jgi:large subunit ribosomal protein L5
MSTVSPFQKEFQTKILPLLKKELKQENDFAVPRLEKVVVNVGLGKAIENPDLWKEAEGALSLITGQKPVRTLARKSISSFKIRNGLPIGLRTTLRGKRMYDFVHRLVNVTLPRVRDFRGLDLKSFDGKGNYTIGFKEYPAFPEINPDQVNEIFGLEVIVVTTAKNNREGELLLRLLGFPLKEKKSPKTEKVTK